MARRASHQGAPATSAESAADWARCPESAIVAPSELLMAKYGVALVLALLLNAAANLMIKFGMRGIDLELAGAGLLDGGPAALVRLLLRHWILLLGLACFAANVVFYSYALQKLPISAAYPIMTTCGFVIIVVVAGILLHERLSVAQWVGVVAILVGVVLVARDAGRQMGGPGRETKALPEGADG